jgi:modulator of FtsH protease HflC
VRRPLIIAAAAVFAIALLARAMAYTVRFTETGVLTTFGKADENAIKKEPGLYFKWPDPIQSVTKYDTRARFLQTQSEAQQTADSRQLVVEAFCTWRVEDPLKFFQKFSNKGARAEDHYAGAQDVLRGTLRSAMGEVSRYRMDDLFTNAGKPSKLPELEAKVLANLQSSSNNGNRIADYGIHVESVGINGIVLPEETTKAVFESMKADRARLVKELESKGAAEAQTIKSTADANARRIEEFAKAYAAEIRRKGDEEAATYVNQMNEAPDLAVFLKQIDFIKQSLGKRITWIVDTTMPGFELFAPSTLRKTEKGEVPGVRALMGDAAASTAQAAGGGPSSRAPAPQPEGGNR